LAIFSGHTAYIAGNKIIENEWTDKKSLKISKNLLFLRKVSIFCV